MKKIITILLAAFLTAISVAQSPQKMKFQAVARDNSGNVLANQTVSFKISILSGSVSGAVAYSETQNGLSTNTFGLVEMEIGNGAPVTGLFSSVNWGTNSYFVKVEMDPAGGSAYQVLSTSQLLSVPYALHAKTVETGDNWGTQRVHTDATLLGHGTTANMLKIAQQGATSGQVLKWDGSSWQPGTDATGAGLALPFSGNATSSNSAFKVTNSGVAIEGYSTEKEGVIGESDSPEYTGVYGSAPITGIIGTAFKSDAVTTGVRGTTQSNATGSSGVFGKAESTSGSVFGVTGEINSVSGAGIWGYCTNELGQGHGLYGQTYAASGAGVLGIGQTTGIKGIAGSSLSIGFGIRGEAFSAENGTCGVYGSASSMIGLTYGVYGDSYSTLGTGVYAVNHSKTGSTKGVYGKVLSPDGFSGFFDGPKVYITGRLGVGWAYAPSAGIHLKNSGFPNTFMFLEANEGQDAGFRLYEGETAQWHIFNNAAGGGLHIYNSTVKTAIFVKQSNSFVGIGHTNPAYQLHVGGDAAKTTGSTVWIISSDKRLKDVTGSYLKGLAEIALLNPVKFSYKTGNIRNLPSENEYVGFIAQDVKEIFPESVSLAADGYYDMDIHAINIALVNAVKELKAENEQLKNNICRLETVNKTLEERLSRIESAVGIAAVQKTGLGSNTTFNP